MLGLSVLAAAEDEALGVAEGDALGLAEGSVNEASGGRVSSDSMSAAVCESGVESSLVPAD